MKNLFVVLLLIVTTSISAQAVLISDVVSENKITTYSDQKLIIIDFWATWCAPCVSATKQLEILQKQNKDKVFVVSMSDEHSSKIEKYLEQKPIELMVSSDSDNFTFTKYQIQSRPSAILLDLKGNLLWKGHPSDLTQQKLDNFFDKQRNVPSVKDLFSIIKIKKDDYIPTKINDNSINIEKHDHDVEELIISDDFVTYYGTISNLYFVIKNNYPFELFFDADIDEHIKLTCSLSRWNLDKDEIIQKVFSKFDLKQKTFEKEVNAFEFKVQNKRMLWDSNQFDWEGSPTNYIEGTDRLQADNVSIKTLCGLLSKIKNQNFIYNGNDNTLYDWDLQYLYNDLMVEELESSFGILLKPIKYQATITEITKK